MSGCTNAVRLTQAKDLFGDNSLALIGSCPSVGVVGYLLNGGSGKYITAFAILFNFI